MLGVLAESEPLEKLPFALLGCGRFLCLLKTLWLLWLSGLASTSCSEPGGTIYSTPGIAMVLEVEEYGDPAMLMVVFRIGCLRRQDLPRPGPWLFVVVVLCCGSSDDDSTP